MLRGRQKNNIVLEKGNLTHVNLVFKYLNRFQGFIIFHNIFKTSVAEVLLTIFNRFLEIELLQSM